MSYKSPIEIAEKMSSQMEDDIMKAIISYNINVDKDELIKALTYDRKQYEKGYEDGQKDGRTAKVIEHDASITDTDGNKYLRTEYLCGACKKKVIGGDEYCSHCGTKLDWSGNE